MLCSRMPGAWSPAVESAPFDWTIEPNRAAPPAAPAPPTVTSPSISPASAAAMAGPPEPPPPIDCASIAGAWSPAVEMSAVPRW